MTTLARPRTRLALVNPVAGNAWAMNFVSQAHFALGVTAIPAAAGVEIRSNRESVRCDLMEAQHLVGVRVRPIKAGEPLPEGRLRVVADGEMILETPLENLAEWKEPGDYPWRPKAGCLFPAGEMEGDQIAVNHGGSWGYVLPNGTDVYAVLLPGPGVAPGEQALRVDFNLNVYRPSPGSYGSVALKKGTV